MSENKVKVEVNGTNGFGMPLFGFPKMALFGELAENGIARAQEGCEKIKAASGEMAETLRETYSSNAKSANDLGSRSSKSRAPTPPPRSISSPTFWGVSR